jgi:DNA polymerase (family 10)
MPNPSGFTNLQIAELLRSVAAAYQLKDAAKNKFKIVAYQRAADAVEHATSELKDLWDDGKLEEVPGIGPSIAAHLDELFKTGRSKHFEAVMKGLPPSMFQLMKVPGIGAKTGYKLAEKLGIKSIPDLEKAAKAGKISNLEGFGEESQKDIIKSIEETKGRTIRHLLPYAEQIAGEILDYLKKDKNAVRVDPLGSLRRQAATVGDIDISVATNNPKEVLDYFTKYPKAQRTLEKGDASSSIVAPGNVQVDLMVQPVESYGSLLQHFTGSKHHNIALREYALKKGLSLSEYGIKKQSTGEVKKFKDEESFYKYLGLEYIPPELREDTGEIEAAKEHKLPKLVELGEVKADLQIHSSFNIETSHDLGESSMEELVEKADELGYEYIAFTDHNPSQRGHNDKQIIDLIKKKNEAVEKINYSLSKGVKKRVRKVFNSLEIDILPDGRLPVPEEAFAYLDFALVSIHSNFRGERDTQTKRVLSALSHTKVKIFAHPTGRKLNEREGAELNWPEIFDFCLKNSKWVEINCDPMRLDLPDTLVHEAVKRGVKLTFGTDAHHKDGMNNMMFGVSVARRGWVSVNDIINTRSLTEFEKLLKGGD